jgi:hypothetical protein
MAKQRETSTLDSVEPRIKNVSKLVSLMRNHAGWTRAFRFVTLDVPSMAYSPRFLSGFSLVQLHVCTRGLTKALRTHSAVSSSRSTARSGSSLILVWRSWVRRCWRALTLKGENHPILFRSEQETEKDDTDNLSSLQRWLRID